MTLTCTSAASELDTTCRAYVDAVYALPGMQPWIADAANEPKAR